MGKLSIRRCSIVSVDEVRVVSTSAACEFTSTTSRPPAIVRATGNSAICPTVTLTCSAVVCKTGCIHSNRVVAGGQRHDPIFALCVDVCGSLKSLGLLARRDGCVCNHATIGIFHNDVQIAGGRALGEGNCAKQQQRNCKRDGFPQIHKFLPGVPRYKKKAKNQNQPSPGGL